jgi:hypothetical protein
VSRIASALRHGDICLILGGAGGIGKSVFFESLLRKRELSGGKGVWKGAAGPTRVVNLLECNGLDDFQHKIIQAFYPAPFLPSFGLSPPPSYDTTLVILKSALQQMPQNTSLLLYLEDVNSLVKWPNWQDAFISLAIVVGSSGNGLVIGNSSSLLAYKKFEPLSHAGLRTKSFFIPSLPRDSEELAQYAADGGHLYRAGFSALADETRRIDLTHRISLWNGNVQMIKMGSDADVDEVRLRVKRCLEDPASLVDKPQWAHIVVPECAKSPNAVLELRASLLQLICDAPKHEVPLLSLPLQMRYLRIAEQLAAADLVTFRTLKDASGAEFVAAAPYHPVVLTLFQAYKASIAEATGHCL